MEKKILSLLLASVLFLISCKNPSEQEEATFYRMRGDTVYVTHPALTQKLILSDVCLRPYSMEVVTAGTVQAIPTRFAYIAAPFSGRVIKSYVKLGQVVRQGTPLFEISSPDFTAAQKEYFQALSSLELAQKDLRRKEDLIKNGVSSQKELEEAQNEMLIAEKEYENSLAAMEVYQVGNPEQMRLGQPLIVRAPISGTVIENHIVNGEYLREDADPVAVVADLSQVWVAAQVKEKDIRFIKEGNSLEIEITALPGQRISGTVYHINEVVDEETRSIRVLSVCDNTQDLLRLGMYATVHFMSDPTERVHVPEKALLQGEKGSYVYSLAHKDTYVRKPVEVEVVKDGFAVISAGLSAEEKIIGEGGYYLK